MNSPTIEDVVEVEIKELREYTIKLRENILASEELHRGLIIRQGNLRSLQHVLVRQPYDSLKKSKLFDEAEATIKASQQVLELEGDLTVRMTRKNPSKKAGQEGWGLSMDQIERVDKFGELLASELKKIGQEGRWGQKFDFEKPGVSDYWRARIIRNGVIKDRNWLMLNGRTYYHPAYASPKPWKIHARFGNAPKSRLWEKKQSWHPHEFSLGGKDVWAISYDELAKAISEQGEEAVLKILVDGLRQSFAYTGNS